MMHLEFFCPSVGYTSIFPEFSVVLKGEELQGITVEGQSIFKKSGDIVLKSSQPLYEIDGSPQVGGYASFRRIARGRLLGPFDPPITRSGLTPTELNTGILPCRHLTGGLFIWEARWPGSLRMSI
jgi:hypothetical protein